MAEPVDRIVVGGPDAVNFLQGQLSQDVAGVPVGGRSRGLLLQPDGKLGFVLGIERADAETVVLTVDAPFGDAVRARLDRFKLRVDCTIELDPAAEAEPDSATERHRIEAGLPRMGTEIVDGVIPQEAGVVEGAVDFDKGCYVGQELVARIDSRGGNVPRRLRRLVGRNAPPPAAGAEISIGGEAVGEVTSSAATDDGFVALGYVRRAVEPPASATVRVGDQQVEVAVEAITAGPSD